MPGELSNPEFMFPGHYDSTYELGTNPFATGILGLEDVIQLHAETILGHKLNKAGLDKMYSCLAGLHLLSKIPGEQEVQEAIQNYLNKIKSAKKVASRCLT